jgi:hypothetical protein
MRASPTVASHGRPPERQSGPMPHRAKAPINGRNMIAAASLEEAPRRSVSSIGSSPSYKRGPFSPAAYRKAHGHPRHGFLCPVTHPNTAVDSSPPLGGAGTFQFSSAGNIIRRPLAIFGQAGDTRRHDFLLSQRLTSGIIRSNRPVGWFRRRRLRISRTIDESQSVCVCMTQVVGIPVAGEQL